MAAWPLTCPLDAGVLLDKARADTGLDDFGPRDYRERLDLLARRAARFPRPHGPGRLNFHFQMLQLLKNRLLLTDLLRRHPEIHDVELVPPVVIAGLPRSGTTHLHHLLAAGRVPGAPLLGDASSRSPFPPSGVVPDPRLARCDMAMDFMNQAMPHFALMHEIDARPHPRGDTAPRDRLLDHALETLGHLPAWRDHYRAHDQEPHYAYLRSQLQALQHLRGRAAAGCSSHRNTSSSCRSSTACCPARPSSSPTATRPVTADVDGR